MVEVERSYHVLEIVFRRFGRIVDLRIVFLEIEHPKIVVDHVLIVVGQLHDADTWGKMLCELWKDSLLKSQENS
jgi:hypothetical protein